MKNTANQRLKNQRQARIQAGWQEVRVWVPTKDDALEIQELAARLRAKALDRKAIEQLPGVKEMDAEILKQVMDAIENQNSPKYLTPSGAFLELLAELAKKGHVRDMSSAYKIFVAAHPSNANLVANLIGAKIANNYFIPSLGLDGTNQFIKWEATHPDWSNHLAKSLATEQFELEVQNMLSAIRGGQ